MAKFKRLSRFLERIGIKKKQAKESVELASSSRSWRRFWKRSRMEHRTPAQPASRHQSTTNDLSRIGSLFRVLKMKSFTSKCRQSDEDVARPERDAAGNPELDVARDESVQYSSVSDSDNLLSSADTVVIVAGSSDEDDPATTTTPIRSEPSYSHDTSEVAASEVATCEIATSEVAADEVTTCSEVAISEGASITEVTGLPIVWDDSFSDLTSITDMTLTDHDQLEDSGSITNLTTEDDVTSMTSKSIKIKFDLMEIQGGKDEFEETQLNNNDQSAVSNHQLQCGGIKELVDEGDEGKQSIDDYIIVFLPVIVVIVFMFLLLLTGC